MRGAAAARDPVRDAVRPEDDAAEETLIVDLDLYEGPLDLLLALARAQKVDLSRISILRLAEQYLAFIGRLTGLRLEVAADHLVMAAWLAYLKSRLLLPQPGPEDEGCADDLAGDLAHRLRRLAAMREAAAALLDRARLGRDVFARGMPEAAAPLGPPRWSATLYELLEAYAAQRQAHFARAVRLPKRHVIPLAEARERLLRLVGQSRAWTPIDTYLADHLARPDMRTTARASALAASLELVREGRMELRQSAAFAPLHVRAGPDAARAADAPPERRYA